jgi:hypothetical protein
MLSALESVSIHNIEYISYLRRIIGNKLTKYLAQEVRKRKLNPTGKKIQIEINKFKTRKILKELIN